MENGFDWKKSMRRLDEKISKIAIATHSQIKEEPKREIEKPKETWVKVGVIRSLTGWDKYGLRRARESNLVKAKWEGNKVFYLLESLHPSFIINKNISLMQEDQDRK